MTVTDYGAKMEALGIKRSQNYVEITSMLQWLWHDPRFWFANNKKKINYLEVGAYAGESLLYMSSFLPKGSTITVVDQCEHPMIHNKLLEVFNFIESVYGHSVNFIQGDSTNENTISASRQFGPFDICFIDANHTFEYIAKDIQNYASQSKVVILHDISEAAIEHSKTKHGVEQAIAAHLWKAWKMAGKNVVEFIDPKDHKGLGVYVN